MDKTPEQIALTVSQNTIIVNILLAVLKLAAGVIGRSAAMLSDSVHSFSDVFSTLIVMASVKIANKTADKEHPYGHERFECVAALILSVILGATGLGIGYGGLSAVIAGDFARLPVPSLFPLLAAVVSVAVKEGMYRYAKAAARKINSGVLLADAWHHRSDALSSVGSFLGICGARIGFPVLDPLASLAICLFIIKAAAAVFIDAVNKMTDRSCDDDMIEAIRELILAQKNVAGVDLLRTRLFGDKVYVDVEIAVDRRVTLCAGHDVAHAVHDAIEDRFPAVKHCMVHINPRG